MSLQMAETSGASAPPPTALPDKPVPDAAGTLAKGEFARFIGVTPGRVSQYISGGKIGGEAITESGRIRVEIAKAQLLKRLDVSQMTGNGLDTRLAPAVPIEQPPPQSPPSPPPIDSVEEKIKRARLEGIERDNRKKAEDEAARAGRYVAAEAARQQLGRVAGAMVTVFESALAELATAIAAQFKVPQRDVLHLLRTEFRNVRSRAATSVAQAASDLPALIESDPTDDAAEPAEMEAAET